MMKKRKILILGGTGMAGHLIYFYLKATHKYNLNNTVYRTKLTSDSISCNVREEQLLKSVIIEIEPDIIINCVGALIRESKEHQSNAIFLNAYLPHLLTNLCNQVSAKLIHISTDCVFSGSKGNYKVDDFKDADDMYGRSKSLGEVINDKDLTIRTSIIGPEIKLEGEGLFHWLMAQKGNVKGYKNAIWGGITTLELAKSIEKAIDQNLSGLIHITNGEPISKYKLLVLLKEEFKRNDIIIQPFESVRVDKSLAPSKSINFQVLGYKEMIADLKIWMKKHTELYVNYHF